MSHTIPIAASGCSVPIVWRYGGYGDVWYSPHGVHPHTVRERMEFCRRHRRVAAKCEWATRGYPPIDWNCLHDRLTSFHTNLRCILDPSCPSTHKTALRDEMRKNNKRFIYKGLQHKAGYNGPRGEEML